MMDFTGKELQDEFKAAFGKDIKELSVQQIWWLVKVAKHCRGRCRSNAALTNYLNKNFIGHTFRQVSAETQDGKEYDKLEIKQKI